ncbi:hypothetical protein [Bradyrhizobium sp. SYSU BS000235]|uniref:hypothetical protein n=1 Tax=Bradyrhizobium sp. SYSU BS000235 TaxID=3411332 RepID=UPI003C78B007
MSPPKTDRRIQSISGKGFRFSEPSLENERFANVISQALRRQFGETHASIKTVVALTKANERAVKNWFSAKNGPTGEHLVDLVRSSDEVLEAVLLLSGRRDLVLAKKVGDAKAVLHRMLKLMEDLEGQKIAREE